MKRGSRSFVVAVAIAASLLTARPTLAEPLPRERVPAPLQPWVDWVLQDHEDAECPVLQESGDPRRCAWPASLALDLGTAGGHFTQVWRLHRDGWIALPGDDSHWPLDVKVDGKPAVVVPHEDRPSIRLPKGRHEVAGSFAWSELPEVMAIPGDTALVRVTLDGKEVPFPKREPENQIWLTSRSAAESEESRLEVHVDRKITDEIPLELVTRIELRVSGKNRETLLARALPDGFVPTGLESPLPARLEADGRVRVQLRAGVHVLEVRARHDGPATALTLAAAEGPWAGEEVWAFESRNDLRLVSIEDVPSVDPQQTQLPDEWRAFPAYLMRPGSTMKLDEKRRGDADPPPDQLTLQRSWWLDFDGGGYTISDRITGSLGRSWRLDMPAPIVLGRVAVDGQDQLITKGAGAGAAGVEIRQGALNLEADSRIPSAPGRVPAVGWSEDFHQVSGQLYLPPGWRLFHASGVDDVSSTWVAQWSLLDLFLVLVIALAAGQIWGRAWGAVALVTLGLTYLEAGAPRMLWVALLAGEALIPLLPAGRVLATIRAYRGAVLVGLVVVVIPFMVEQVRFGMYPGLESPGGDAGMFGRIAGVATESMVLPQSMPAPAPPPMPMEVPKALARRPMRGGEGKVARMEEAVGGALADSVSIPEARPKDLRDLDEKALVSTGPGLPRWQWRMVTLGWRGPVEHSQQVSFWLLSPFVNFLLALLRVGLLGVLMLRALGAMFTIPRAPAPRVAATAAALLFGVVALAPPARAADYPPQDLLNELQKRLLAPHDCDPSCASSGRVQLETSGTGLVVRIEIDAAADTAVALPGGAQSWSPAKVMVDGASADALARDDGGTLWLALSAGKHQVVLDGPLPRLDAVDLPLPLRPHHVEAHLTGWSLEGVQDDGTPEDSLRLVRERKADAHEETLQPTELPPFSRVEREIRLGLVWEIDTVLTRLTPTGTALTAEVPLLPGESVTTPNLRIDGGKAILVLAPGATEARWHSVLKEAPALTLASAKGQPWTEVWRLDAGALWHVEPTGIPPIHAQEAAGRRVREWRPWPGESVSLAITRPEGFPGQTSTIDHTALEVSPGLRSTDATLTVELRSSRGGQHTFTLPEGAALHQVAINGATQPIRQEKRSVTVPVAPGSQTITLAWRSFDGIAMRISSPAVSVGAPSVNADTTIQMPADRWTLAVGGGRLGPAVLFWSFLFVLVLVAAALGRVTLTPLRTLDWFLLGIGLTQTSIWVALAVAGWLLVLGWRRAHGEAITNRRFDLVQILLALWTLAALAGLFGAIQQGLLGEPDMQIAGNGSSAYVLRWYHDHAASELPRAWVISVPLLVYRLAMLAWALWIARALLSWLRWGWDAYSSGGLWRPWRRAAASAAAASPPIG